MGNNTNKGYIGFDLDGSLAEYHGWDGILNIGKPIQPSVDLVKKFLSEGIEVRIFTARVSDDRTGLATKTIEDWCEEHIGQRLKVTNVKDFDMLEYYDDRAIQLEKNTGKIIGYSTREY